jgi:hypothetical protein
MESLILYPTATAQWHALVHEASTNSGIHFSEDVESYLVFLLMRFINRADLNNDALALEFLSSITAEGNKREQALRDLGDKCLLFSGLFPNQAEKRSVNVSYFVKLGKSAYDILAELHEKSGQLFVILSREFVHLMDVLLSIRINTGTLQLSPLQLHELWHETQSQQAKQQLSKLTTNTPMINYSISKDTSH